MTKKAQEAYMKGFCKAAEAYGVNPGVLAQYFVGINKEASMAEGARTLRSILVGGRKLTPRTVSRYILGPRPTSATYLGYDRHSIPQRLRAGVLDRLLTDRVRHLNEVLMAVDRTPLGEVTKDNFLTAISKARHSGAGPMLDNVRTGIFNSGGTIPSGSMDDLQGAISRYMSY